MTSLQPVATRRASIPQKRQTKSRPPNSGGLGNFVAFLTRAERGQGDVTRDAPGCQLVIKAAIPWPVTKKEKLQ
ncbi:MAG: hypothetical protein WB764_29985 [Xanthobacteraceae bacterium]